MKKDYIKRVTTATGYDIIKGEDLQRLREAEVITMASCLSPTMLRSHIERVKKFQEFEKDLTYPKRNGKKK